jgi:hypothetical protein
MVYCSAFKNREILSFATTQMDLEDVMLNGISQVQKDKYHKVSWDLQVVLTEQSTEWHLLPGSRVIGAGQMVQSCSWMGGICPNDIAVQGNLEYWKN